MAVPIPKLTAAEYLALERKAEYKSEYFGGEMFAMAGGTGPHANLAANLIGTLYARLAGKGCHTYTSDMKVRTGASGLHTYPDVSVVCGSPKFADDRCDVLVNPKLIIEVLSESTEAKDRGFKFQQYKRIESLHEYVLVSQTEALVERFWRDETGAWTHYAETRGLEATVTLRSLDVTIPLAEMYRDIDFES
jgi:Uma2 family endonuclease